MKKYYQMLFCIFVCFMTSVYAANNAAPDSTSKGPHEVVAAEYRLPAGIDKDVLKDKETEIWAKVFYPKDQTGKAPLVVMLHGNHATCGDPSTSPRRDTSCYYTNSGQCPPGYIVVPSHEGYNYLAENLASWGFWVVSVNANRGINCSWADNDDFGLIYTRGKLVLKHLALLYQWSTQGGAPESLKLGQKGLADKIDFSHVGLFGHSRGGQGVRAAYNLYSDEQLWQQKIPSLGIKAIYEVGATDFSMPEHIDAKGVVWNQLLPMCDGDVSDLQGRMPFERMMSLMEQKPDAQKSLYEVWGANHNFFNTEWQQSDSVGCNHGTKIFNQKLAGSVEQQAVALASVPAFFRSHLTNDVPNKEDQAYNKNFNPLFLLPETVTNVTQVDRDFTPTPGLVSMMVVEDFDKKTGINSSGNSNLSNEIIIKHKRLINTENQHQADISWQVAAANTFFEAVFAGVGQGVNAFDAVTLDFRIAREKNKLNSEDDITDFGIKLEDAEGHFSNEISVSDYALLNGPGTDNLVFKTVRIPLSAFTGVNVSRLRGVRFVFDKSATGFIHLANMRLHRDLGLGSDYIDAAKVIYSKAKATGLQRVNHPMPVEYVSEQQNEIREIKLIQIKNAVPAKQKRYELRLASKEAFPVTDAMPVLKVGDKEFKNSRYSDMMHLQEITFMLSEDEYLHLSKTAEISVKIGKVWKFGNLTKWLSRH